MKFTGIKATEQEIEELRATARRGWMSGDVMIVGSMAEGIRRDRATMDAKELCHRMALDHGLPEIQGFYGMSQEGEFVTVDA